MKLVKTVITAGLISISLASFSQKGGRRIYDWSLGCRAEVLGTSTDNDAINLPSPIFGPAFKFLIDPQKSIEIAALSDFSSGGQLQGIFNIFNPFPDIPQSLRYYMGLGLHAGRWNKLIVPDPFRAGVDGQLGVEFIPRNIPLAISLDWHPRIEIVTKSSSKLNILGFGLTVKYYHKH